MGDYADLLKAQSQPKADPSTSVNRPVVKDTEFPVEPTNHPPIHRTNERLNKRPMKQTSDRSNGRTKIRHTFDIFADQLLSLRQISLERETVFGERTLLGDLVQEALDMFITKERTKE